MASSASGRKAGAAKSKYMMRKAKHLLAGTSLGGVKWLLTRYIA